MKQSRKTRYYRGDKTMRIRTAPFSSETRYVSPNMARTPSSFGECVRIYFNILLLVLLIYFLWYYLLPLL